MKVAILGAGAYGRALGKVARDNGHATKFFDPFKFPERSLEAVLEWAEVVLLATPAEVARKLLGQFPVPEREKSLVVATKGLMNLAIYRDFRWVELVSGPGFASEILRGKKVKLTVATQMGRTVGSSETGEASEAGGKSETVAERVLAGEQVKFDSTEDARGVALLSGLKNIYAIEAGRRGLEFGTDEFKEHIHDALCEAEKMLLYNGGFLETVRLNAGVGDFVLTCGSRESRNYRLGELMRMRGERGRKREIRLFLKNNTVEGLHAAREIKRLGLAVPRELEILPDILRRIYAIK